MAGGIYEHQFRRNTGKQKLKRHAEIGHLFFDHRDNLRRVELRYAHGSELKHFFDKWSKEYPDPYPQRYRKGIPFKWVKDHATLLMVLTDGEVTYPQLSLATKTQK